jgi:hypothetical protein
VKCVLLFCIWNDNALNYPIPEQGGAIMDVSKILDELRQEREQLEEAILSLERLARGRGRRRGRPPSWMVDAKKRGRPAGSKNKAAKVVAQAKTVQPKNSSAAA